MTNPIIYLPALFFGGCTIYSYKKYGINIQVLMYGVYFVTGIASILLDKDNLYEYNCLKRDPGIIAPVMYCWLIWLCISPFSQVKEYKIRNINIKYPKILDYAVYFYFSIFLIIIAVASTQLQNIVTNAEFAELRQQQYDREAESFYNHLSGIPRYICALTTFFLASSYILIPILFINIIKGEKSIWFNIITLLGSTCQLLTSIMQADRSQFVYWFLLFIFSLLFFKNTLSRKKIKKLSILFSPLLAVIIIYFITVSISRWGETAVGSEGGTIRYAGQNFYNFCNVFNVCLDTPMSFTEIFPLTYYILGGENYFEWCRVVQQQSSIFMAMFPTFVGIVISMSTTWIGIIYCIVFHFVAKAILFRNDKSSITFIDFIKIWILAIVPTIGVFGSFYMSYAASIAIIIWLILGYYTKHKTMCRTLRRLR